MLKPTGTFSKVSKFLYLLDKAGIKHKDNIKIDWADDMVKIYLIYISMLSDILDILIKNFAEIIDYTVKIDYISGMKPMEVVIVFKECIVKETNVNNKEHQMLNVEITHGGEGIIETRKGEMCELKVVKLNKNGKRMVKKNDARKNGKRK